MVEAGEVAANASWTESREATRERDRPRRPVSALLDLERDIVLMDMGYDAARGWMGYQVMRLEAFSARFNLRALQIGRRMTR